MKRGTFTFLFTLLSVFGLLAQDLEQSFREHILQQSARYGLSEADLREWKVSSQYESRNSGLRHLYVHQTFNGIEVKQATANAHFSADGRLVYANVGLIAGLEEKVNTTEAAFGAEEAIERAAVALQLPYPPVALEPVVAKWVYQPTDEGKLRLCWEVSWYEAGGEHYWVLRLDALTGKELYRQDMVVHCDFGAPHQHLAGEWPSAPANAPFFLTDSSAYRVYPQPVESPNHGNHELVTNPADPFASPFGWHDTDGAPGAEYTITRGNNVHAYQDSDNNNQSAGDEPDGGPDLVFDFPFDLPGGPEAYQDAATTNLFYWCNLMHDVCYHYGFDEPAGNFQANNYGSGGEEGDYIRAEAQDGGGTNNANFSSNVDGSNARIQMYLWTNNSTSQETFSILEPSGIAGFYESVEAAFGPGLSSTPITGEIVLVNDGTGNPSLGCEPLVNAAEVAGKIALIDRGFCNFPSKVTNAQLAGAIAVIICQNQPGPPTTMAGNGDGITIPSIMITEAACNQIKANLQNTVLVSLQKDPNAIPNQLDGDLDNGIICHEYGHGVSIRLTGGPNQADCLTNAEQMGEGWSDWFSLIMTMDPGDMGGDIRGIGTFAIAQSTTGVGIRPAPYSTDFGVNDYTYGDTNDPNLTQPHGVGFVWATMLWDLTWALIDLYGFDEDLYEGSGGNNIAFQLIMDGMKLQSCNPGFVDGRNAILLADSILYSGAHQCLIWDVFAKRGLGFSADQGSSFSRSDQFEAFDIPYTCLVAVAPPVAAIGVNNEISCSSAVYFDDLSQEIPQSWFWDFGDGATSTEQNPVHEYAEEGEYTVTLIAANDLGQDTATLVLTIDLPEPPTFSVSYACEGQPAILEAEGDGVFNWYQNGEWLFTGDTFATSPLAGPAEFWVETEIQKPVQSVGAADNTIGSGGFQTTNSTGTLKFVAFSPFIIEKVTVYALGPGNRNIRLYQGNEVIQTVTVNIPNGQQEITLNLEIPGPGSYAIGSSTSLSLYRNKDGGNYPYEIPGIVSITGSSSGTDYYYYFYNWQVRERSCYSSQVPVAVDPQPAPEAGFAIQQAGASFDFTDNSQGATSWQWDFGDGNASTLQHPTHTYLTDGTFTVTQTVSNGTCQTIETQEVSVIGVATKETPGEEPLVLRPNPGNGLFEVEWPGAGELRVEVFTSLGQLVWSRKGSTLDISQLPAGIYLVAVEAGGARAYRRYVLAK